MEIKGKLRSIDINEQRIGVEQSVGYINYYFYCSDFFNNKEYIYKSMFECKPLFFEVDGKIVKDVRLNNE